MADRTGRLQRPVDRLVAKVERREAQRPTSLGARGSPCPARWVRQSRLQGCYVIAPWRLPPLHPLAASRGTGKPRTHQRRESAEAWLFEIVDQRVKRTSAHHSLLSSPGFDRATQYSGLPVIHANRGVYWVPAS